MDRVHERVHGPGVHVYIPNLPVYPFYRMKTMVVPDTWTQLHKQVEFVGSMQFHEVFISLDTPIFLSFHKLTCALI